MPIHPHPKEKHQMMTREEKSLSSCWIVKSLTESATARQQTYAHIYPGRMGKMALVVMRNKLRFKKQEKYRFLRDWDLSKQGIHILPFQFIYFLTMPHGLQDLSFLTRDPILSSGSESVIPNHWTVMEFPSHLFSKGMATSFLFCTPSPISVAVILTRVIASLNNISGVHLCRIL